uniref:Muscarinic acetylcholine receptor M3 n=1 Tax=Schistocephalus solidus TaxID=70667 RepID=A0A0V0J7R8_SCHSO
MYTQYETVIYSILSTIVSIACISGNLLVLVAFILDRGVRTSNNYFIISLAFTDILIGLISINFFMLYLMLGYWPLGNIVCECWMAMDFTLCFISQVTVFMITIDRYLSVTHALRYRNWRTDNKLKVMLAISWILPTALWTTVIFGWYHFTDDERPPPTACNVPFTHFTLFNTLLTVGYFWIPLVFITSLYIRIYNVAVRLQRKVMTAEMGLAELMMMAGTTMSTIGLGVKTAHSPDPPEKLKTESQCVNITQINLSKIGNLRKYSGSGSTSGRQTTVQTECLSRRCTGNEIQRNEDHVNLPTFQ